MRNLRNTRHAKHKFVSATSAPLAATAWDASDNSLVLGFGPTADSPTITLKRLTNDAYNSDSAVTIASWDAPSPNPEVPIDRIVDLHCFPDTKTISLVFAGGDIVAVREDPQPGEDLIEIVGSVDAGITAAVWSPDEELLAVATAVETLLFMTRDFEGIANIALSSEDVKVSNHVSVGWGKKETQFKGRGAAKTLRDPTIPEHVDEGMLSPFDDGRAALSWRGDGQYVALNKILNTEPRRRIIRVYSREGTLESVSEPTNGLEGSLSWRPGGQTIAAVQRRHDKIDVVFFERNGLRHGEFSLRLEERELSTIGAKIDLDWNLDSTVLAVSMVDRVQMWTVSNYHYYLKQEVRVFDKAESSARVSWHPEKPLHLVCTKESDLRILTYRFEVCRGSVCPPHDFGTVAVIDGAALKVTPLRLANVPPPMAFDEIELPQNALDVVINDLGTEIAVLHYGAVSLWSFDHSAKPPMKAVLKSVINLSSEQDNSQPDESEFRTSKVVKEEKMNSLYTRTDHDRIFYLDQDNYRPGSDVDARELQDVSLNSLEPSYRLESGQRISFELFENGLLHVESPRKSLRVTSCTSFVVTPVHLIYTTGQNLLKFTHLHHEELNEPSERLEEGGLCRSIERGAKIVTVIPSACSLVLQMPRGNLETIYPRALVLEGVRQSLNESGYMRAFSMCRMHRVDMNILYDYRPDQFMSNLELFVEQIRKTEYMDLFLSSLSEEDVSQTMYHQTLDRGHTVNGIPVGNSSHDSSSSQFKVNKICTAILQVLQRQSPVRLQNVVTAYICKNPPDLEAGLRLVSKLRSNKDSEKLEQAVEHVCFLGDVNQLYDTALGIYDLDVALLVAQQSQKDPREYLPYLQRLHDMQPLQRKFAIDNDLNRHTKAISHLHALNDFEEVKSYMCRHSLYGTAVNLYRYDDVHLTELMRLYADFLSDQNNWTEAGIAYEYILDYSSAYKAFRTALMWQECLANAMLVPVPADELLSIAKDLADALEEAKDFKSSAVIHFDYLHDVSGAAALLCKAHEFGEAIRQVVLRRRPELLASVVDHSLIDASAATMELLAEMKSQLGAQIPRLRELRQKKAEDPMAFLDGANGGDVDIPDNLSLAPTDASTSGSTFMTRYTNRSVGTLATNATRKTSKNRRREERKRARGKKGTVYEEEYLVNSIARLVERIGDVGADVSKLVEGLMRRGMRERAVAVQNAMDDVSGICKDCIAEVFSSQEGAKPLELQEEADEELQRRPWGGQGVLWDAERSLHSPRRDPPELKPFRRLSILD